MPKMIDLTGQRFGRLTAIYSISSAYGRLWYCKCSCGKMKEKPLSGYELKNGIRNHCGCIKYVPSHTHGKSHTKLYKVWSAMKHRCDNPNDTWYHNYGGRGISYYDEWKEFMPFHYWAYSNGYKKGLTLERIDVDGNYGPSNCTWIPKSEQTNNRRINKNITYKGKTQNMKEWADELGFEYHIIQSRITKLGWSVEKAFETPANKLRTTHIRLVEHDGQKQSIAEWSRELRVNYNVLYKYIYNGKTIEQFLSQCQPNKRQEK